MNDRIPSQRIVLLGIGGGVAAYKSVEVASTLHKAGFDVHVAMSPAARQFVGPVTFAAVSGNSVLTEQFPDAGSHGGEALFPHLYPATRAGVFILAPATADMIAKIAHGLGGDVVSTGALSLPSACRRFFCPSMNVEMWHQPAVQENVRLLESRGWIRIGPDSGALACGMTGEGRMSEPEEIVGTVCGKAADASPALLKKKVLILSGPTREHLDPIRFIGNPSSGKMGQALADEAAAAGARVFFVTGPVDDANLPKCAGIEIRRVVSAAEMLAAGQEHYPQANVILYAAAVADYRPAEFHAEKLPKKSGTLTLKLASTPDIAATLNLKKRAGQICIGFALQTGDGEAAARAKLKKKNLDGIVLNSVDALGGDSGTYRFFVPGGAKFSAWGKISKRDCARRILAEAANLSA